MAQEAAADLEYRLAQAQRELSEAREEQAATAEVLQVISSSPDKLEHVFETILANATRLCEAKFGNLFLLENDALRAVAMHGPSRLTEWLKRHPEVELRDHPRVPIARAAITKEVLQVPDFRADQSYIERDARIVAIVEAGGRSLLAVPMLKEGKLIGVIAIYSTEVRPFTEKQIDLVKNFVAQAVIAIENTRLLKELRQRTDDLGEALEHQTATGEILVSISGSVTDTKPVFDAIVRNLGRLFRTRLASVQVLKDGMIYLAASADELELKRLTQQFPRPLDGTSGGGRAMLSKQVLQFAPVLGNPAAPLVTQRAAREMGFNAVIFAPMIREDKVIGAIATARRGAEPFDDKQIALIKTFADQAVIAIENVRLFDEVQARTRELSEALEQQTATSEVLGVISRSPGELEPVFQAMLENATRICEADLGSMVLYEDGAFRRVAAYGAPPAFVELRRREPVFRPHPEAPLGRLARTKQVVHVEDMLAQPEHTRGGLANRAGARSLIIVPMLKENELIGAIAVYRQEMRPFTGKQIELVQNFAAQAVIAIENTRLLNELRASLQRQSATSEVLQVISSSPGELEPVFNAILENATRICEAKFGTMYLCEGDALRVVAMHGAPPSYAEARRHNPVIRPRPEASLGRALATRGAVQIADIRDEADYGDPVPGATGAQLAKLAGAQTVVIVPMLRENAPLGAIIIYRQEVRQFTDKQVELVTNFAAQAVIAIENTRLLNELRESLQQQTATADVLKT